MSDDKTTNRRCRYGSHGKNLALNIESRGYSVALFNRTGSKTEEVVKEHPDKTLKQPIRLKSSYNRSKHHDAFF